MKWDVELILDRKVSLQMLTYSKSLFDSFPSVLRRQKKRLCIYINAVLEVYKLHRRELFEVSDVGFVRSEINSADAFIKIKYSSALFKLLKDNKIAFEVE